MKLTMKNLKILSDVLLYDPEKMKLLRYNNLEYGTLYALNIFFVNGEGVHLLPFAGPTDIYILSNGKDLLYFIIFVTPRGFERTEFKKLTEEVLEQYHLEYSSEAEKFIRQNCAE